MSLKEIECTVKSCIISKKDDTTLQELNEEYHELVGQHIPFGEYGYKCLEDFIVQLPGVYLSKNSQGHLIVSASSEKAKHISSLVARQRKAVSKVPKRRRFVHSPKKFVPSKRLSTLNKRAVAQYNRKLPLRKNILQYRSKSSSFNSLRSQESISCKSQLINYGCETSSHGRGEYVAVTEEHSKVLGYCASREFPGNREGYGKRGGRSILNIRPTRHDISTSSSESLSSVVSDVLHRSSKMKAKHLSHTFRTNAESREVLLHSDIHNWQNDHYRTVCHTNNSVQCVLSSYPNSSTMELDMSNQYSEWDTGPVMFDFHLVGDDFLLHFAYESLVVDCECEDGVISCGMCTSGQTIRDFHLQLCHYGEIEPRIVMMLGSCDILQGSSLVQIINDMMDLLNEISSVVECIVLLTLPFLVNGGLDNQIILHFNEFLRGLDDGHRVRVLDVHTLFKARRGYVNKRSIEEFINYKCYERYATSSESFPNGITLWSHLGRSIVYNCLIQNLPGINRALLIES